MSKTIAARNARPNSPTNLNSTLNRPMASQSGTRYEDRTIQRAPRPTPPAPVNHSAAPPYRVGQHFVKNPEWN